MQFQRFLLKWIYLLLLIFIYLSIIQCPDDYQKPNQFPTIESLYQTGFGIPIRGRDTLVCLASDPDGDSLIYTWSAPAGEIRGTGDSVIWYAPEKVSTYPVYCKVQDIYGASDERSLTLQVFDYDTLYLPFNRLIPTCRMPAETLMIIQDDSTYQSIWEKYQYIWYDNGNALPMPHVNFDSSFVACVSFGYGYASGCVSDVTFIDNIYVIRDSVFISLTWRGFLELGTCFAEQEPRHWVIVPDQNLPIRFEDNNFPNLYP